MYMQYVAPEAKLIAFVSMERLANATDGDEHRSVIDFDSLLGSGTSSGDGTPVIPSNGDITMPA